MSIPQKASPPDASNLRNCRHWLYWYALFIYSTSSTAARCFHMGSLQKATHILKLIPCKVSVLHELKPGDPVERVNFYHWFQKFIARWIDVLNTTFFSDRHSFLSMGMSVLITPVTGHSQIQTKKLKPHKAKWLESAVSIPEEELLVLFFSQQALNSSDGSVVHELVQLNESFNWTNLTTSQFWNELVALMMNYSGMN